MIRRHVTVLTGTALAGLLVSGCGGAGSHDSESAEGGAEAAETGGDSRLDAVLEEGVLDVCTTGDYPPFTEYDEEADEYEGIDIDMVRGLAEEMGVEIEWVRTSWDDLMDDYLADCDIAVGGISINADRAQQVFFSRPLMADGKTPITHDNLTVFDELAEGNADVMTTDRSEVLWVANEYEELCAVNPDEPFDYFEKAYMLPRGDTVFTHYVDQWLTMSLHDGTYHEATSEWFGDDVEIEVP